MSEPQPQLPITDLDVATDHQIDISQHSDTLQAPERQTPTVKLNYVLYNHGAMENAPKVLDAVADADLILMEVAGGNPEDRDLDQDIVNGILKTGEGLDSLANIPPSPVLSMVRGLAGSGKELHYIDYSDENTDIVALGREHEEEQSRLNPLFCDVESGELALQLEKTTELGAEFAKRRDELMRHQIEQRIGELTQDTNVAVLVGAAHSSISHSPMEIPNLQVEAERTWLPGEENTHPEPSVQFHFGNQTNLERQINLGRDKPTSEAYKQAVAELYLTGFMNSNPGTVVSFTPEEGSWQGLLSSIDECCKQPLTRDQKWQHIQQIISRSPYVNIATPDNSQVA